MPWPRNCRAQGLLGRVLEINLPATIDVIHPAAES
jgi:hypothetical protein